MTFRATQGIPHNCSIYIESIDFFCDLAPMHGSDLETIDTALAAHTFGQSPREGVLTHASMPMSSTKCTDSSSCWLVATSGDSWIPTTVEEDDMYGLTSSSASAIYPTTEPCLQSWCHSVRTGPTPSGETRQPQECKEGPCFAQSTQSLASSSVGPTRSGTHQIPTQTNAEATTDDQSPHSDGFCPTLLPRCLNTWLSSSWCTTNTASDCFCRSEVLVADVMACMEAWAQSPSERFAGVTCLSGICAGYIRENPAIITARPTMTELTSGALASVCPDTDEHVPVSERKCTTVTYHPAIANHTKTAIAVAGSGTIAPLPYTNSAKTLTIPLIYLGTSTVINAPTAHWQPHSLNDSASASPFWPAHSHRPFDPPAAENSTGYATASESSSGFPGNFSVQTVKPFASGASRYDIWILGLTLVGVIPFAMV